MNKQKVNIESDCSFDRATEIIMDLVMDGFSVEAESKNSRWHISAEKPANTPITIKGEDIKLLNRNDNNR